VVRHTKIAMGSHGVWIREENVYLRESENAPRKEDDPRWLIVGTWRRIGWRPGGSDSPEVKGGLPSSQGLLADRASGRVTPALSDRKQCDEAHSRARETVRFKATRQQITKVMERREGS